MARFTLLVALREFTPDVREGVKVSISTSPAIYPVPGVGMLQGVDSGVTDESGEVSFDLVSLPGLSYVVSVDGARPVVISGDRADGVEVRLDEAVSVTPSPIPSIDAAALRAEILALIESGALDGEPGQPGPPGETGGPGGGSGPETLIVVNGGTVTLDDTKAEGSLVGYRVKSSTEFSAASGAVTLEPGAYTFERTEGGWTCYAAEGVALVPPVPEPTWTPLATDTFAAADNTALIGRTTTTGGLTYADKEGSSPDIRIRGNRATFEAFSYGNTVRLLLGADHASGLRVSMDYEFYGVAPQVGSLAVLAGTEWTPHSAGFVLDQNSGLALAGSVPPKNFAGAASGHPKTGRLAIEWRADGTVHALIGGIEVATAAMDSPMKGQLIDIGFGSNAVAIDNLLIEAVA